ncbi:MAG: RidA family protein [Gemmatimonadetes bacterium]|nr:RidA family protein [Gemmatimonadota bacterium]
MSYEIINPEDLGAPKGWNNGMLAPRNGRILFVAGQAPSDETGVVESADFVTQFSLALARAIRVVEEAGGKVEDIGRLTIFVSDMDAYRSSTPSLGAAYRALMGRHYPAMSLVEVSRMVDDNAIVEIETTAVIP